MDYPFSSNRRAGGRSPKVVSIPVHFVQPEQTRTASALKIQKVVKGFLVRKSVKQIVTIVREIEKMERWISEKEKAELIRNDAKERLRVSETVMSLLLKLDSVRGINPGVRDCRKRAIKRAIALQDKLDRISSVADPDSMDVENLIDNQVDQVNCYHGSTSIPETVEAPENMKTEIIEEEPKTIHCMTDSVPAMLSSAASDDRKTDDEDLGEKDVLMEGEDEEQGHDIEKKKTIQLQEKDVTMEGEDAVQDKKRTRELLEKMAEDNEKLVGMVTELSQRNETQTRLLSALTHRVEVLEKAFVAELLAKKQRKKKQGV